MMLYFFQNTEGSIGNTLDGIFGNEFFWTPAVHTGEDHRVLGQNMENKSRKRPLDDVTLEDLTGPIVKATPPQVCNVSIFPLYISFNL